MLIGGGRVSFGTASERYWAKILSVLPLYLGFLMIGFTKRKQGLHDKIAGCTIIVK